MPTGHHHRDFPVGLLVAARQALGATVDVVIPARDEEATVGAVVAAVAPLRDAGLVDDVVVVDSHSTDATARRAAAAGARVVHEARVRPDVGSTVGKGAALWKGLAATTGDLVVFLDADLLDVGPHFVTGLLGPLLTDPSIDYVKATYDRPTADGRDVGGRVTELMARPLLNAFWPELAWLGQPLAGEYAGRRSVLASVPFVHHYGVELGLLVDLLALRGASAITQVDLVRRTHGRQHLTDLTVMSAQLLHVALDRLGSSGRLHLAPPASTHLIRPQATESGRVAADSSVAPSQYPPLADAPSEDGRR